MLFHVYLILYRLITYSESVQKEMHQGIVKNSTRVNHEYSTYTKTKGGNKYLRANEREFRIPTKMVEGLNSVVDIATRYGLDGPGIEFRWRRDFPHPSRPALGPAQPPVQWVPDLSRG